MCAVSEGKCPKLVWPGSTEILSYHTRVWPLSLWSRQVIPAFQAEWRKGENEGKGHVPTVLRKVLRGRGDHTLLPCCWLAFTCMPSTRLPCESGKYSLYTGQRVSCQKFYCWDKVRKDVVGAMSGLCHTHTFIHTKTPTSEKYQDTLKKKIAFFFRKGN